MASVTGKSASSGGGFERKLLLKKIAETTELPSLNVTVTKLLQLLRQEDVSISEVIRLVERDQALVAQILKVINSGYYSLRKKIESVGHAVNLLGLIQLKSLVYGLSVMNAFGERQKLEWEHSYSSSLLMERLLKECGIQNVVSQDLTVSMLLHDIGRLILREFSPKKYEMACEAAGKNKIPIHEAETQFLQINHAEAARVLLDQWQIDESIAIPIEYHHAETMPPEEYLLESALIQFVDWVDFRVREITVKEPSPSLLRAAGIEEIDKLYWVSSHRKVVSEVFSSNVVFQS